MPIEVAKDDIIIINPNIRPKVIAVHPSSKGTAKENLESVLANAQEGDIIIGDFNVNFLDKANLKLLEEIIAAKNLRMDVTLRSVENSGVLLKIRSLFSMFNQQLMKGGTPDISLKDLAFKLVKKEENEPTIPEILQKKLNQLIGRRQKYLEETKGLKQTGNLDEDAINAAAFKNQITNFQSLFRSYAKDHFSSHYLDKESGHLVYAVNLIKNEPYDFENHFRDGNKVDVQRVKKLYQNLDTRVLRETYKLFAKVDGTDLRDFEHLSNESLKSAIEARLKDNTSSSSKDKRLTLSKDDFEQYFYNVITSPELARVNAELKRPYPLDDKQFVDKRVGEIVSENNLKDFAKSIGKIINVPYQALYPGIPTRDVQGISLQGNGFPAFVNPEDGSLVPIDEVEQRQSDSVKIELLALQKLYPNTPISVIIVEGVGQEAKCKSIQDFVEMMNNNLPASRQKDTVIHTGSGVLGGGIATAFAARLFYSKFSPKYPSPAENSKASAKPTQSSCSAAPGKGSIRSMSTKSSPMPFRTPRLPHPPIPQANPLLRSVLRKPTPALVGLATVAGVGLFFKSRNISFQGTHPREDVRQQPKL